MPTYHPSENRPLCILEEGDDVILQELTDSQLDLISYLIRKKYAERLADTTTPTKKQLVVWDNSAGTPSNTIPFGELTDSRRMYFIHGSYVDTEDNRKKDEYVSGLQLQLSQIGSTNPTPVFVNLSGDGLNTGYSAGGETWKSPIKFRYGLGNSSTTETLPDNAAKDVHGFLYFEKSSKKLKVASSGSIIKALVRDAGYQMGVGDGIGSYYIGESDDSSPSGFSGDFQKVGFFYRDTRTDVSISDLNTTQPRATKDGKTHYFINPEYLVGSEPNFANFVELNQDYSFFVKTDDSSVEYDDIPNLARMKNPNSNLSLEMYDIGSDHTKLDDFLDKVLMPYFINNNYQPTYSIGTTNPNSDQYRGFVEDTWYGGTIQYAYQASGSTVYQLIDIPDSSAGVDNKYYYFYINSPNMS